MESPVSCQNPDLDSELIRLCIRVLEKLDYLGIGLIISKKMHIQIKQMDIYQFRMDIRSGESYIMLESRYGLRIDRTLHPSFGKV